MTASKEDFRNPKSKKDKSSTSVSWKDGDGLAVFDGVEGVPGDAEIRALIAHVGKDPDDYHWEVVSVSWNSAAWHRDKEDIREKHTAYTNPSCVVKIKIEQIQNSAFVKETEADIAALCRIVEKRKPSKTIQKSGDRSFLWLWSDLQAGKGEGGGSPALINRMGYALDRVLDRLKELERLGREPDTIYIVGMGDLVEGCGQHYAMQTFQVDLDRRQQTKLVRRLLLEAINVLTDRGYNIVLAAVPGNHGECFDEETEFLTQDGWKFGKNCSVEDTFGTLNSDSETFEWQKPTNWTSYFYNGEMCSFVGRSASLVVTPNHDLWTSTLQGSWKKRSWKKTKAENFVGKSRVHHLHTAKSFNGTVPSLTVPEWRDSIGRLKTSEYIFDDPVLAVRLFGWYVAEGYTPDISEGRTSISQSKIKNPEHYDEIWNLLEKLGFKQSDAQGKQIRFNHAGVTNFLHCNFGGSSSKKRLPQWLKDMPKELLIEFLDAYSLGDGHQYSITGRSYKSNSSQLIDDLQEVCAKIGFRMSVGATRDYPVAGTSYMGSATEFYINQRDNSFTQYNTLVKYAGNVYCPTVPNGLVFVRRHGKMVVSGNSRLDGKAFTNWSDNDDVAVFEQVAEILSANPERYSNVLVPSGAIDREDLVVTLDLSGVPCAFAHGHQFKNGVNSQAKAEGWWKGQALGRQPVSDARLLFSAHFHHFVVSEATGRTWMQAPAMDGGSAWITGTSGVNSPAGMLTVCVGDVYTRGWGDLEVI